MEKSIFKKFVFVIITALITCSLLFSFFIYRYILGETKQAMLYSLKLVDYSIDYSKPLQSQIETLNPLTLENDTRITLINMEGTVLADTSTGPVEIDNHVNRKEFKDAVTSGTGASIRYSQTLKRNMLYVAYLSTPHQIVVRLSVPLYAASVYIEGVIPAILISAFLAFILALVLSNRLSSHINKPLKEISKELLKIKTTEPSVTLGTYKYDELNAISKVVMDLSESVATNIAKLKQEKNKIDYILDHMDEGLILLDNQDDLMIINQSAKNILEIKEPISQKNILHYTHNPQILSGIKASHKKGSSIVFDINTTDGKIMCTHIQKVNKAILGDNAEATIILFVDVTSERQALNTRQVFFSNVSHELKTPITAIYGFAELLESNLVTDASKQQEMLSEIKTISQHMTTLINDILMISRLETQAELNEQLDPNAISQFKLKPLMEEIIRNLSPLALKNNIKTTLECDPDLTLQADYTQIYYLFNNLISNATQYNKENGSIHVSLKKKDDHFIFQIQDTGIGIPPQDQPHVFERFYRVDKGRSRKLGGTGLGLSIVKHIVNVYHGTLHLQSTLNKGTTITITLPIS